MGQYGRQLRELAACCGVQTSYYDVRRRRKQASRETLLATLAALGEPMNSAEEVPERLRQCRQQLWQRVLEPVAVAWDGQLDRLPLRLPSGCCQREICFQLELEGGPVRPWRCDLTRQTVVEQQEVEGVPYRLQHLTLPDRLPPGYHRLTLEVEGWQYQTLVIAAPKKTYSPQGGTASNSSSLSNRSMAPKKDGSAGGRAGQRSWGTFLPLYALHSAESWGAGNFSDLDRLWQWTAQAGGSFVATLPLLAAFLDEPYDPSPYAPVSRLFWNEFYVDPRRAGEWSGCREAQQLAAGPEFQRQIEALRRDELVDYRRQMALQRQALQRLARHCCDQGGPRRDGLERFLQQRPEVQQYARFRAATERQQRGWTAWPEPLRGGQLQPGDYDPAVCHYHGYVQWLAHEQIHGLVDKARQAGPGLYLDLPLGVHRDGYDTWRQPELYALQASGGAPPDAFFTKGQDWGFPPLHPGRLRQQGYGHLIAFLRHHLEHAGMLRIDHVMQLHRLFWVPQGMDAAHGAYVQYPAEELYAILSLESHRSGSLLIGENLGTVPSSVNTAMNRHGIGQMYVTQYSCRPDPERPLAPVPRRSVASLNTHDMPTFAAFWEARELDDLHQLGLFTEQEVQAGRQEREAVRRYLAELLHRQGWLPAPTTDAAQVLVALHNWLAAGTAELMLVNLEDLWLEPAPQNVPGTGWERPNWRRKAQYGLDELTQLPGLLDQLQRITELRKSKRPKPNYEPDAATNDQ